MDIGYSVGILGDCGHEYIVPKKVGWWSNLRYSNPKRRLSLSPSRDKRSTPRRKVAKKNISLILCVYVPASFSGIVSWWLAFLSLSSHKDIQDKNPFCFSPIRGINGVERSR
jgi:hypothetical protein